MSGKIVNNKQARIVSKKQYLIIYAYIWVEEKMINI